MRDYYLLEVLDGVYFAAFKDKDSLIYTVDQNEAWKTADLPSAKKMFMCLSKLYNIEAKIKVYDLFPSEDKPINNTL